MSNQTKNNNLNYLIDSTFTSVNTLFVLSFKNETNRTSFSKCYVPKVEIKDFNALTDGKPFFVIPIVNTEEVYEQVIEMSKNNDYTTGNLLDYEYFSKHYRLIAIYLSKRIRKVNPDLENPDLKQQISFTGRLERNEGAKMLFIIEKKKKQLLSKCCNCCFVCIKMETQKIVNLLNDSNNKSSRLAIRKWNIINDQKNVQYDRENENDSTIQFETKVIKPSFCDCPDTYILVTGDIKATDIGVNANVAFKNFALFIRCVTHIKDENVETVIRLDKIMTM